MGFEARANPDFVDAACEHSLHTFASFTNHRYRTSTISTIPYCTHYCLLYRTCSSCTSSDVRGLSTGRYWTLCGMFLTWNLSRSHVGYIFPCPAARPTRFISILQDSQAIPADIQHLPRLRHLTVDTHIPPVTGAPDHSPALWASLIAVTRSWACPLASINLRQSEWLPVTRSFVDELLDAHASTLRSIAFIHCDVPVDSVLAIATRCRQLTRLCITVPSRELVRIHSYCQGLQKK